MLRFIVATATFCLSLLFQSSITTAFSPPTPIAARRISYALSAKKSSKPSFNKSTGRWDAPANYNEEETYGVVGSLLRQGPGPFIVRITKPDDYEQAVLKYMASENCSRVQAQANMDAYFNNAADWSYQKMQEKKGAPKVDYNKVKTKDVALALIWAVFITPFFIRAGYLIAETGTWDVSLDQILNK